MTTNIIDPSIGDPATGVGGSAGPDRSVEIADALVGLIRLFGNLKSRMASVVDPEMAALFLLVRLVKSGPTRAKDLAESMCADPSTVSRQVASLVKSGLIERKADPDDGRASILVPTDRGVARVHEHAVNRGLAIAPIIEDWSAEDQDHFLRLLRRYSGGLELRREEVLSAIAAQHGLQNVGVAQILGGHHSEHQLPTAAPSEHQLPLQARIERSN